MTREKMMTGLLSMLEAGHNIEISTIPKRMGIGGCRDWHIRFVWDTSQSFHYECEWAGFATAAECVEDLVKTFEGT